MCVYMYTHKVARMQCHTCTQCHTHTCVRTYAYVSLSSEMGAGGRGREGDARGGGCFGCLVVGASLRCLAWASVLQVALNCYVRVLCESRKIYA